MSPVASAAVGASIVGSVSGPPGSSVGVEVWK
jgi:hypothetical protein